MKFFVDTNIIIVLSIIANIDNKEDKIRAIKKHPELFYTDKQIEDILFIEQELAKYKQDVLQGKPTRNQYCYNEIVRDEVMQGVTNYGITLKDFLATSGLTYSRLAGVLKNNLAHELTDLLLQNLDNYECFYEENKYNSKNDAKIMADVFFQDGVVLTLDKHFLDVCDEIVYRIGYLHDSYSKLPNLQKEFPNINADRVASVKNHFHIIKHQKFKTDNQLEKFIM